MQKETRDNAAGDDERLVADTYRSLATEVSPKELDRRILRQAASPSDAAPTAGFFASWHRALALAATVALSIALLLQLTEPGMLGLHGTEPAGSAVNGDDPFTDEADRAAREIEALERSADTTLQRSQEEDRFAASTDALSGRACNAQVTSDPDLWWDCIDALNDATQTDAAREELERLRETFPDFVPPR